MGNGRAWCRYCREEIRWAKTTGGKNVPLNPVPHPLGRWVFDMGRVRKIWGLDWERAQVQGEPLYVGHMETCSARKQQNKNSNY